MATGWNYIWGESWHEYIQRSTITGDLTEVQRASSRAMVGAISAQTASILTGMESSTRALSDEVVSLSAEMARGIDAGFSLLSGQMDTIAGEISGLNATFEWGFGQTIAQMDGMNTSLQELIRIAKTPVQTWAYNQFDIARDNFRKGLYTNCLKRLEKAINGDPTSPGYEEDWRFHQMIGVVRLGFVGCEPTLIDLPEAEKAFLLAASYAKTDEPREAAKALLSAGWSAFVQGNLQMALTHTTQAMALDANLTEAYFQAAKFHMAADASTEGLQVLRKAIERAPEYVVKASADGDFQRHLQALNSFYEAERKEIVTAFVQPVEQALTETLEWAKTIREVADCAPTCDRWRQLPRGSWGLLDLLTYRKQGFDQDRQGVANARSHGLARIEAERRTQSAEAAARAESELRQREAERQAALSRQDQFRGAFLLIYFLWALPPLSMVAATLLGGVRGPARTAGPVFCATPIVGWLFLLVALIPGFDSNVSAQLVLVGIGFVAALGVGIIGFLPRLLFPPPPD